MARLSWRGGDSTLFTCFIQSFTSLSIANQIMVLHSMTRRSLAAAKPACWAPAELQSANRWIILRHRDAWHSFTSLLNVLCTYSSAFIASKCLSVWWPFKKATILLWGSPRLAEPLLGRGWSTITELQSLISLPPFSTLKREWFG